MTVNVRAGELRERITFQRAASETDPDSDSGDDVLAWEDIATVAASAEPLSSSEYEPPVGVERGAATGVRFRFRYSSTVTGVTSKDRVLWRSNPYDISQPVDLEGRRILMEVVGVLRA